LLNLICPKCKTPLTQLNQELQCKGCQKTYPIIDGIPSFIENKDKFYHEYYQTQIGTKWAKGHVGFKNPILSTLYYIWNQTSIVGKRYRFFQKVLRKERDTLILDLGCGGGYKLFIRYGNVVGVDLELAPLKNAKNLYRMAIHADIATLPFEDNTFDYILSADVMGHIPVENKDKVLSEIYRVLKKGGKTAHVIETESNNFLFRFAQKYPDLYRKSFIEDIGGHFGLEASKDVLNRFNKHKFRSIKVEKLWGIIWPTEEYVNRFDNAYKEKSRSIKMLVSICKVLNKNIIIFGIINILLGAINYLVEAVTPLEHGAGILVVHKK